MELNYNLYALLETVGFIQAITLGSLLILLNKRKYKSTFFLGLFLLLFGLETVPIILESLDAYRVYPELYLLPFDFFWLHFPVFHIYVQQVSVFSNTKKHWWVLYPGILMFFVQFVVFFFPYESKVAITESSGYSMYLYLKILYGLSIGIWTLKMLYHHKIKVHDYFSMVKAKELDWAKYFLIFNISGSIIYSLLYNIFPDNPYNNIFFAAFDLVLIYWVSYHGVEQRNVLSLLGRKQSFEIAPKNIFEKGSKTENVPQNEQQALMDRIETYLLESEVFIHSELTIVELGEKLEVHPRKISNAINSINNQNFNSYVNHFRVKKAMSLLKSQENLNLTIEGVGTEVGFNSKSAFYSAFKKETGFTPTRFRQQKNTE